MSSDSYDKFSGAQAISSDAFYRTGPAQPARGGGGGGGEEVRQTAIVQRFQSSSRIQLASLLSVCVCAWQMFRSGADFAAELTRGALDKGKELAQDWDLENKSRAVKGKLEQVFRGY